MKNEGKILLDLKDEEWPGTYIDTEREIVRAFLFDDEGYFYFCGIDRDDEFGCFRYIETSGGGVEPGEDLYTAVRRELREELGAEIEVLEEIGIVRDYYNLIHRHNINHYYLCRLVSFGDKHLTEQEKSQFHLRTLKMTLPEALRMYEKGCGEKLGRLVAAREIPILEKVQEWMNQYEGTVCKRTAGQ